MKASTALKKAFQHNAKANELMNPVSKTLSEILDDDCAHIVIQPGDGLVVAYNQGRDNACIRFTKGIDHLLTLNKDQLLDELDEASI